MTSTIQGLLDDKHQSVQHQALITLKAAIDHSETSSYIITHIHISKDHLHGLIFTPGIISAICNKLRDTNYLVQMQAFQTLVVSMSHSKHPL
jgi:REP element-mobilizing transposase RayT